jgi:hypothetical protein
MKCSVKRRIRFIKTAILLPQLVWLVFSLFGSSVWAQDAAQDVPLDDKVLWLPKSYQQYYIQLVNAAQAALAQERCIEVKRATLDLVQSTEAQPIYRVLCMQISGKTYTEIIDGSNYQSLTPEPKPRIDKDSTLSDELTLDPAKACRQLLVKKTLLMIDLRWLTLDPVLVETKTTAMMVAETVTKDSPDYSSSETVADASAALEEKHYQWDFDAKTIEGKPLHFRGECIVSQGEGDLEEIGRAKVSREKISQEKVSQTGYDQVSGAKVVIKPRQLQ